MRALLCSVFMFALMLGVAAAQETKQKDEPKKEYEVDVHFMNGSTVRMRVQSEKMEIETIYGKLTVPMRDIRSVEFGSHLPDGFAEKIDAAVKKLAHSDYKEREKGSAALIELGPYSYAAAVAASRSKENEIASRAKGVMQKLQSKFPKKDLKIAADDRIVTPTLVITGRILSGGIKARADYFGVVELSLADMRTLRSLGANSGDVSIAIDAGKYAVNGQWLATNFHADGISNVLITAKGQVDLLPEQPGNYIVGPNGARMAAAGGGGVFIGGKKAKGATGGVLQGKFGENGDVFNIGDRFDGRPPQGGNLFLHITPSQYGGASAGSYEVRAGGKD